MYNARVFAQRLLLARRDLQWDQDELARKSGVSRGYISEIERLKKTNIGVEVVFALADALGVTIPYLLGLSDDADRNGAQSADAPGISEEAEEAARIIDSLVSHAQRRYCLDMIKLFVGYRGDSEKEWAGELELIADQVSPAMAHSIAQRLVEGKPILNAADFLDATAEHQHA